MRILIVDDDQLSLDVLDHALTLFGHETVAARNGREAIRILYNDHCRVVISDWIMPGVDGLELCRRIRAADLDGYTYVILLTSRDSKEDIVKGLEAGADDFLTKPFHPEELRVRVRAGERVLALETREVAIFAMAKLAESRDPETGEHLERMRRYSRILANDLLVNGDYAEAIDRDFVRLIYLTSPLHDIGKVGIPDSVLLKPDRLSDREFEIMKTHTTIGAETLEAAYRQYPAARYLELARNIALSHHERFDGSGYPRGLAGDEIPLSGRIVAVADVYDALTSKRVYKPAFSRDVARNLIVEEAGRHFDPVIVEAFVRSESEFTRSGPRMTELELVQP